MHRIGEKPSFLSVSPQQKSRQLRINTALQSTYINVLHSQIRQYIRQQTAVSRTTPPRVISSLLFFSFLSFFFHFESILLYVRRAYIYLFLILLAPQTHRSGTLVFSVQCTDKSIGTEKTKDGVKQNPIEKQDRVSRTRGKHVPRTYTLVYS